MKSLKVAGLVFLLIFQSHAMSDTGFNGMLAAAKAGDTTARVIVAYAYLNGEYRDGTSVEQDFNQAYAWASLANYQKHGRAQGVLNLIIPQLQNREAADKLASEFYSTYGAAKGNSAEE